MEETNKCCLCSKEASNYHYLISYEEEESKKAVCGDCYNNEKLVTNCYKSNGEFVGKIERIIAGRMIKRDKAIGKDSSSIIVLDEEQEKKCILCNEIKEKKLIENKICYKCKIEKGEEGVVRIVNKKGKAIDKISITKKKYLENKKVIKMLDRDNVYITNIFDKILFSIIFRIIKKDIVVSRSGKWSCEAKRKESKELLRDNLAERMSKNVIRMNVNIEDFKAMVIKRDKRKCKICGKKAHGVFSKSEIKVFSNSICACINCEYLMDDKKYLSWLNISEKKFSIMDLFRKNTNKETVILYEYSKKIKFRIEKSIAKILEKEDMISLIGKKTYKLNYDVHSFREFIVNREDKKCHYCGKKGKTVDHVIPKSKGGLTTPKNCVCACEKCNTKKGNTDKENFIIFMNQSV